MRPALVARRIPSGHESEAFGAFRVSGERRGSPAAGITRARGPIQTGALLSSDAELWQSARAGANGGPRVLMATSIGSHAHAATLETVLSAALTFRGAEVHALLCDGAMTACAECDASLYPDLEQFARHGPSRDLCRNCLSPAERLHATRYQGLPAQRVVDG